MNNQMVQNSRVEVPETSSMNDENYLNCLLETEKNMSDNLSVALNEASNETLYNQLKEIFDTAKQKQRDLYELAFSLGWYPLEKAEQQKITQKYNQLSGKMNQLV